MAIDGSDSKNAFNSMWRSSVFVSKVRHQYIPKLLPYCRILYSGYFVLLFTASDGNLTLVFGIVGGVQKATLSLVFSTRLVKRISLQTFKQITNKLQSLQNATISISRVLFQVPARVQPRNFFKVCNKMPGLLFDVLTQQNTDVIPPEVITHLAIFHLLRTDLCLEAAHLGMMTSYSNNLMTFWRRLY